MINGEGKSESVRDEEEGVCGVSAIKGKGVNV